MRRFLGLVAVVGCFACPAPVLATSWNLAADVFFTSNSAAIRKSDLAKVEELVCRLDGRKFEILIAVGHAASGENGSVALSRARAEQVARAFEAAGIGRANIYAEGKGNRQPVADNRTSQSREKNRRVEIEVVVSQEPRRPLPDCTSRWMRQLRALDDAYALIVARSVLRDDWVQSVDIFTFVAREGRTELLAQMMQPTFGAKLQSADRRPILAAAVRAGNLDMVDMLIGPGGIRLADLPTRAWPLAEACGSFATTEVRLTMMRRFLALGASPARSSEESWNTPLACAVGRPDPRIVDLLLTAGADPNESPGLVVLGGQNPEIVKRMLAAGADPRSKRESLSEERTLFHSYRLTSPDDVAWLVSLGLDINEPTKSDDTPLRSALRYASDDVLDAMLAAGADLRESDDRQLLPAASENPTATMWLLRHGASRLYLPDVMLSAASRGESRLALLRELLALGLDIDTRDRRGKTSLAAAIGSHQTETVQFLVEAGANRRDVDNGKSALALAQELGSRLAKSAGDDSPNSKWTADRSTEILAILQAADARR